jgi:hypothetical protein
VSTGSGSLLFGEAQVLEVEEVLVLVPDVVLVLFLGLPGVVEADKRIPLGLDGSWWCDVQCETV